MPRTLSAQILAITMLALLIIAIIVVGVYNLTTRDVRQTVANREYQRLYNVAENQIFQLIDRYGDPTVPISRLTSDFSECASQGGQRYKCEFIANNANISTEIEEAPEVVNYEMQKDESLELNVNNYNGQIIFSWQGTAALEFGLLYRRGNITRMVVDLFDIDRVFDSTTENGDDPLTNPLNNHVFNFRKIDPSGIYAFTIRNTQASVYPPGSQPILLRVTARKPQPGTITLNIRGESSFPDQVRIFTATGYDTVTESNVVAKVSTQIPLMPQSFSIFNYSLLVNGPVIKDPPAF